MAGSIKMRPSSNTLSEEARHTTRIPAHKHNKILAMVPNALRNHLIAFIGEYVGTFLFLFFAFTGTQVANTAAANRDSATPELSGAADVSVVMFIALSFGFSLAVNAWVFFRISGGLFNPAVTLALWLIGAFDWIRAVFVFLAQILGALTAAGIVSGLFPGEMAVSTTLGAGTTVVRGLFIEMFATFQLIFCIIMLAAEKHKSTYLAPVGIGLSLFISELGAVSFTGGSLNPARSFGPGAIHGFTRYQWIYWLGPVLGAVLAVALYRLVKVLEYETANPGQDFDDQEHEIFEAQNRNASTAQAMGGSSDDMEKGLAAGPVSKEEVRRPIVAMGAGMGIGNIGSMTSMALGPGRASEVSFGNFGRGMSNDGQPPTSGETERP